MGRNGWARRGQYWAAGQGRLRPRARGDRGVDRLRRQPRVAAGGLAEPTACRAAAANAPVEASAVERNSDAAPVIAAARHDGRDGGWRVQLEGRAPALVVGGGRFGGGHW